MSQIKLIGISGSLRTGATNRKLLAEAARTFGTADFTFANIHWPLYDGDLELSEGVPAEVQSLADKISKADGILVSTPEYNSALSGVLKNALDWISRAKGSPWNGKPVAIMSAAAGRSGGARALSSLRLCLAPFRPRIIAGPEILIAGSGKAFNDSGRLIDETSTKNLQTLMEMLRIECH